MYLVSGCNIFGQWLSKDCVLESFRKAFTDSSISYDIRKDMSAAELIHIGWSYNIFKAKDTFFITGAWQGKEEQLIKLSLPQDCTDKTNVTIVGNDYSLFLIDTKSHKMWVINLESEHVKRMNFSVETPASKAKTLKKLKRDDAILKMYPTNNSLLCLTALGTVYSGLLPSCVDTGHCVGTVVDIQCGYEHFMLLTDVGRVYTWGNGRRLQLGHGDVNNLETPTEVDALAGIKIIKIGAGGWHCLALSEFGDLYAWGWNDTGQLGIKPQPEKPERGVLKTEGLKSFSEPTLVDLFDENEQDVVVNVKDVACGSRHSAIVLEDNTVWTSGYNKYGQLGFPSDSFQTPKDVHCWTKATPKDFHKDWSCAARIQWLSASFTEWKACLRYVFRCAVATRELYCPSVLQAMCPVCDYSMNILL